MQREMWQKPQAVGRKQSGWCGVSLNYSCEDFTYCSRRYPKPIPLAEVVDFVVECWDEEEEEEKAKKEREKEREKATR